MSVIIKDMNMPKSCNDCPFCYDQMECLISDLRFWRGRPENKEFKFTEERHPVCPLVSVEDDIIETVRCKNCVFWRKHGDYGKCINPASNIASDVWLNPLFYCRSGVKKDDVADGGRS